MAPRDCFGIAVRTIGILMIAASVMYLYSAVAVVFFPGEPHASPVVVYLGAVAVWLIAGLYFLRGAPQVIRFAYPPATPPFNDVGSNI
jgi:hypothetical protein